MAAGTLELKPGQTQVGILRTQDACQGWGRAPVKFTVHPSNRVADRDRGNSSKEVTPRVTDLTGADLVVSAVTLGMSIARSHAR